MTGETSVTAVTPIVLLVAVLSVGFAREWSRPVPQELAFAVPVVGVLRSHGVHVYRISEASHYERGGFAVRAASIQTADGSVSVLQFPDASAARRAASEWHAPRPPRTYRGSTLFVTTNPRLDLALLETP